MSKKIKTVWDSDPTAADDTTEESYFAGEDSNGDPIAYSATQLAGMTGARNEIPTLRSDVDSIIETISSQPVTGQFTLTAPTPNTLTILVSAIPSAAIDRYAFYWDTDGTPSGTDGVAKSVAAGGTLSFTTSLANSSETEPYVNQVPGYLHVRSASGSVWSALTPPSENNDGSNGFLIQAIDTRGYVWSSGACSIAQGTDPTSQAVITIDTEPTANVPQTGTLIYNVWDPSHTFKYASGRASPITINVPSQAGQYVSFDVGILDADLPPKETFYGTLFGPLTVLLDPSSIGEVNFTSFDSGYTYDVAEDGGAATVSFERVDENGDAFSPATDEFFTISTVELDTENAQDGTHYYGLGEKDVSSGALSKVDGTYGLVTFTDIGNSVADDDWLLLFSDGSEAASYSGYVQAIAYTADTVKFLWSQTDAGSAPSGDDDGSNSTCHTGAIKIASGGSTATRDINIIDNSGNAYNYMFQVEIDNGSVTTGGSIGAADAALVYITSTATGTINAYQSYPLGGADIVVLDVLDATVTPGEYSGPTAYTWLDVVNFAGAKRTDTGHCYKNDSPEDLGDDTTIGTASGDKGAILTWPVLFEESASYYMWFRGFQYGGSTETGSRAHVHTTIDEDTSTPEATGLLVNPGYNLSGGIYKWTKYKGNDATPTGTRLQTKDFTGDEGIHNFNVYGYDHSGIVDRIVLSTTSTFNPNLYGGQSDSPYTSNDDYFGPDVSTLASGSSPTDHPTNIDLPLGVVPGGTMTPTSTYPASAQANVPTSGLRITAYFAGATQIKVNTVSLTQGGTSVGVSAYGALGGDTAYMDCPALSTGGISYTWTMAGTGFDSSGDYVAFSISQTFTTVTSGAVLLGIPFTDTSYLNVGGSSVVVTNPVRYTKEQLESDFQWDLLGYSASSGGNNYYGVLNAQTSSVDNSYIVPDPAGTRGNVLRITIAANTGGLFFQVRGDYTAQDEVWCSYDIYFPPGYIWPLQHKLPGLCAGAPNRSWAFRSPSVTDPWRGTTAFTFVMQAECNTGYGGTPTTGSALGAYRYDAEAVQRTDFLTANGGQYIIGNGRWITIEQHWKRNTCDTDCTQSFTGTDARDGTEEVYITDPLAGYAGTLKLRPVNVMGMVQFA